MEDKLNTTPSGEGKIIEMQPVIATTEVETPPTAKEIAEMKRQRTEYKIALRDDLEILKLETETMELRLRKLMMIDKFKELQRQNAHTDITKTVLSPAGDNTAGAPATE
jgi:hypothetical protein